MECIGVVFWKADSCFDNKLRTNRHEDCYGEYFDMRSAEYLMSAGENEEPKGSKGKPARTAFESQPKRIQKRAKWARRWPIIFNI